MTPTKPVHIKWNSLRLANQSIFMHDRKGDHWLSFKFNLEWEGVFFHFTEPYMLMR